ncbi:MAG: hypothetical protein CM15mP102_13440 [Flavobacteriales bacterium]|nr:MAG: hypothetical protein CM15mP102_13440 [Flavobacteriales bacterium]
MGTPIQGLSATQIIWGGIGLFEQASSRGFKKKSFGEIIFPFQLKPICILKRIMLKPCCKQRETTRLSK